MKSPDESWQQIAWRGLQVEVPITWNPTILIGSDKEGYCRFDDAEHPHLELKWLKCTPKHSISQIVDNYLAGLAKKNKRKELPFPVRRDTRIVTLDNIEHECFEWIAAGSAINMAVLCEDCERLTIVRVLFPEDSPDRKIAKRVLRSFRDHTQTGQKPWAIYGLRFETGPKYKLSDYDFDAGRSLIILEDGPAKIEAVRLGLANVVLRKKTIKDVVLKDAIGKSWSKTSEFTPVTMNGHRGFDVRVVHPTILTRLFRRNKPVFARIWECEESNTIHAVSWRGPEVRKEEFDRLVESFQCH